MQIQVETNDASHNVSNTAPKIATRRDVLRVVTGAAGAITVAGAVGAAAVMVPRFDRAQQDTGGLVTGHLVDADQAPLRPGQQIMVYWRAWPIHAVRRSAQALATLQNPNSPHNSPTRIPRSISSRPMRSIGDVRSIRR